MVANSLEWTEGLERSIACPPGDAGGKHLTLMLICLETPVNMPPFPQANTVPAGFDAND